MKTLALHAALCGTALALALAAWRTPTPATAAAADIVLIPAAPVERLAWATAQGRVEIARQAGGTRVTLSDAGGGGVQVFPGARAAELLLETVLPLRALRALGPLPPGKDEELGLARPATLTITSPSGPRALAIGTQVFGDDSLYVRAPHGGTYVAAVAGLSDLRAPREALLDTAALGVPRAQIERVVVTFQGQQRQWLQRPGGDPDGARFVSAADPARSLPPVGAWVDRLLKLQVLDLGGDDLHGDPILTVRLEGQGRLLASLSVGAAAGASHTYAARSSRFSAPILLKPMAVETLLTELATLPP